MSRPTVGQKAPSFSGPNQNGAPIDSQSFLGKKIVLYFYPKDDTPGCTAEACNLRDNYAILQASGYVVLGVSADGVKSHDKFIRKYELPFDLLADEDKSIHTAYGTWVKKVCTVVSIWVLIGSLSSSTRTASYRMSLRRSTPKTTPLKSSNNVRCGSQPHCGGHHADQNTTPDHRPFLHPGPYR